MDDERLVVEVENMSKLYDQSSRHYKDNSKKVIAWRARALEIGSSGDFLHLYCSAAVAHAFLLVLGACFDARKMRAVPLRRRSVIASRLSKEMAFLVTEIDDSSEWEKMLYGDIDWSKTGGKAGM
ncbi:unnamed protein product [Boreogadus saida]